MPVSELLAYTDSVLLQAPPQFGLTCLSHYLVQEAWNIKQEYWLYIDAKSVEWHSIEKYAEKELKLLDLNRSDIKRVVLDSWVKIDKNSMKFLNKVLSLFKDTPVFVMQTIDDNQFANEKNNGGNDEKLIRPLTQLHLLALPRERIRKVVSEYNNERHIGEEDAVISKVVSDLDVLNIHRTPLNCLTLLKVSEKYFDESPINRAEMIRMVLFLLFNVEAIPSYKSRPDLKDCEYILGMLCEGMIRAGKYTFTRESFIRELTKFCTDRVLYVEVEVVFDVLYTNCIIIKRDDYYCFRFSYWVYYFAASRMQQNKQFADFILSERRYANFPEIIEFYTGIDRSREDAIRILIHDLRETCQIVDEKVGLPAGMNPLEDISWKPSEKSIEKMHHQISDDVLNSSLPDVVKDQFADKNYDQQKPYNQSIGQIFNEYSLSTLLQCTRAASRALRNSDYVDPEVKRELLDEIMLCWEQFSKVLAAIIPALAVRGNATVDGLGVMLLGNFGNTLETRVIEILKNLPYNVMDWFRWDLYSEKMSPLLFEQIDKEENNLTKHELILLLIHQRPKNWQIKVREYVVDMPKNSYYLYDTFESLKGQYKYAFAGKAVLNDIKYLIKMCAAKHKLGTRNPGIQAINKISDKVLPNRPNQKE